MPKNPRTALLAALCVLGLPPAFAQRAPPAPAPALTGYRSAFEGYRPFAQEEVQPWKQTNDTVREVGGWRAYAREMQGSPQGPTEPPKSADPHAGHAKP